MAGYGVLWTVFQLFRLATGKEGMGFGDFKLLALLGAWLGWEALPVIVLLSSAVGAIVGVALLGVVGLAYLGLSGWIMERHLHRVHQELHCDLAKNLVAENVIFEGGEVSTNGLEHVFHTLMVVNPNIEVYLLDLEGQILSYSAPYRKVKRLSVDVAPATNALSPAPVTSNTRASGSAPAASAAAPISSKVLEFNAFNALGRFTVNR